MVDASPPTFALVHLQPGVLALVAAVEAAAAESLVGVGIVAGTTLEVERVIPFGGPVVVRLGHARIALGRSVAAGVAVAGPPAVLGAQPSIRGELNATEPSG